MSVTRFIHRNGQGAPSAGDLEVAEVAIDTLTGDVYTKDENGNVVPVGTDYDDTQIIDRIDDLESAPDAPGMVISETEPAEADRVTGMQWLDVSGDDAQVWIWDEDKWLEFPAGNGEDPSPAPTYTLPVSLRGGYIQLPLNEDGTKLVVNTRGGPVELPLMAA